MERADRKWATATQMDSRTIAVASDRGRINPGPHGHPTPACSNHLSWSVQRFMYPQAVGLVGVHLASYHPPLPRMHNNHHSKSGSPVGARADVKGGNSAVSASAHNLQERLLARHERL